MGNNKNNHTDKKLVFLPYDDSFPSNHEGKCALCKYLSDDSKRILKCLLWEREVKMTDGCSKFSYPTRWECSHCEAAIALSDERCSNGHSLVSGSLSSGCATTFAFTIWILLILVLGGAKGGLAGVIGFFTLPLFWLMKGKLQKSIYLAKRNLTEKELTKIEKIRATAPRPPEMSEGRLVCTRCGQVTSQNASMCGFCFLPFEDIPKLPISPGDVFEEEENVSEDAEEPLIDNSPWQCAHCGEEIEGQSETCWNCGADRSS